MFKFLDFKELVKSPPDILALVLCDERQDLQHQIGNERAEQILFAAPGLRRFSMA